MAVHQRSAGRRRAFVGKIARRSSEPPPLWPPAAEALRESAMWSAEDDEKLRKAVKEKGLDDWTKLGEWTEVGRRQ